MGQTAFGYNAQLIVSDITKMTQNIDMFGFRSTDEFAKISARAHDLHVSISELQGVMGKFDTFESAAQTVGQLNSALGTNFDALELMTLKYEDPALMLEKLREGLMSTGQSFDEIPIGYKRMITQQLGITMEGLRGMLDGNVKSLDELAAAQEGANKEFQDVGTTDDERQAFLDEKLKQRVKINDEMIASAKSVHDQAARAAKIFGNVGLEMSETSLRLNDSVQKLSATYVTTAQDAYKAVLLGTKEIDAAVSNIAIGVVESSFKGIMTKIGPLATQVVNALLDAVLAQLPKDGSVDPKAIADARKQVAQTQKGISNANDLYVSPGGATVVTADFGEFNERSFILDKRDELIARPPPESTPAQQPAQMTTRSQPALPAVSDAIRASLQGVGTSLRIELDVGQLTDLVLRDIMMNKPNVFGGIG